MNILLWVLQIMLALHTIIGAVWKFSNPEQTVGSLNAIPHGMWIAMSIIELLCSVGLIIPLIKKRWGGMVPFAASIIAAEMLLFTVVSLYSGNNNYNEIIYWLVVAVVSAFIVYGRFMMKPIK